MYTAVGLAKQKTFTAMVDREKLEPEESGGVGYGRTRYELLITHDASLGMLRENIRINEDTVEFKKNVDDSEDTCFTVVSVDGPHGGMLTLGVMA